MMNIVFVVTQSRKDIIKSWYFLAPLLAEYYWQFWLKQEKKNQNSQYFILLQ